MDEKPNKLRRWLLSSGFGIAAFILIAAFLFHGQIKSLITAQSEVNTSESTARGTAVGENNNINEVININAKRMKEALEAWKL